MLIGFTLPENHRSDNTRTHFSGSMAVVGTLSALVLGLLLTDATRSRMTIMQDLTVISAGMIRIDRLLRQYGPEADSTRVMLGRYVAQKREDLFPEPAGVRPDPTNLATFGLLERVEDGILALKPDSEAQKWRQSQALQLTSGIAAARWGIVEQADELIPRPLVVVVTFWLALVFTTFGLFAPRHLTSVAALLLSSLAVSGAILLILDLTLPFNGLIRIPSAPLTEALEMLRR
jgi:hypothetical protein